MKTIVTKTTKQTLYVLEHYKGHILVLPKADSDLQSIEVYDPLDDTLFIIGLDDSKSCGYRRSIAMDDPIKSAKEYIDWIVQKNEYTKLDSVGCVIHKEGMVHPLFANGIPDLYDGMAVHIHECSSEWKESLSDVDRKKVEDIIAKLMPKEAIALKGKTIAEVRYLSKEEQENLGWELRCVVIQFDDGSLLYPSKNDRGNDAGALFGQTSDGEDFILPVI